MQKYGIFDSTQELILIYGKKNYISLKFMLNQISDFYKDY